MIINTDQTGDNRMHCDRMPMAKKGSSHECIVTRTHLGSKICQG